jgi:hypothetical protein
MAIDLTVDAALEFSVDVPGSRTVTGSLTGSGKTLELQVSDPLLFAGRSDAAAIRGFAAGLARQGVRLTVVAPAGPLVTLGVPRSSWVQRRVTGSRHMRVERGAGLWSLARGRSRAPRGGALPTSALLPPGTMFPILPTFRRRPRPSPTTTHDPRGGGDPRLIMAPGDHPRPGDRQEVHRLRDDVTTIGSGTDCDIRLPGLDDLHAEVRHDAADEFVLVSRSAPGWTKVNGAPVDTALLRTASRIVVGEWTMSFYREEFADHGRPYGGRIGGELGRQRPQPARPRSARPERDWSTGENAH